MTDADELIAALRDALPADRLTSWRAHDRLDDLEKFVWELEDALNRMADMNSALMRDMCPACRVESDEED